MISALENAKRLLSHYFEVCFGRPDSDRTWQDDNQAEIENAVDAIVEAAVDQASKKALDMMLAVERDELRDRFAAAALAGLLSNPEMARMHTGGVDAAQLLATMAFGAADAMLAERSKREAARESAL